MTERACAPIGCVIAKYKDETMRVGVWKSLADTEPDMAFFRQTPPCLVENGRINPATNAEDTTGWGATVDGETIIRRSAFGLDADKRVAFYGMGDDLSAGSLARAMKTAGADSVAQLDVNFSYPRFMIFDGATDGPPKVKAPLAPTPNWKPDEYSVTPTHRDFFYLTRRKEPRKAPLRLAGSAACLPLLVRSRTRELENRYEDGRVQSQAVDSTRRPTQY